MSQHKLQVVAGILAVIAAAIGLGTAIVTCKGNSGVDKSANRAVQPVHGGDVRDLLTCDQRSRSVGACEVSPDEGSWAVNERAEKARRAGQHASAECFAHAAACRALHREGGRNDKVVAAALYELSYAYINRSRPERAVPLLRESARLRRRASQTRHLDLVCALLRRADPAAASPDCPSASAAANP